MLLFFIIGLTAWTYGNDLYYKENPNSIYTEKSTEHPEYFKVNKNTMNFW